MDFTTMNPYVEIRQASVSPWNPPTVAGLHAPQVPTTKSRAKLRRCRFPDCLNTAKPGGLCISYGGGKKCSVENCTTSMVSRGVCVAHGGGKRCQSEGCPKSAQSGGFCWIHGGGKKCGFEGCVKRAQSGGACISHGGGKRYRMDGCNKVVQCDGLSVNHGGHRMCLSTDCETKALANGFCLDHGGRTKCLALKCQKKAVCGDYCSEHNAAVGLSQHHQQQQQESHDDLPAHGPSLPELPARSRLRLLSFATEPPPRRSDNVKKEPRTEPPVVRRCESDGGFVSWRTRRQERGWDREATPHELSMAESNAKIRGRDGRSNYGEREWLLTPEPRQRRHAMWPYDAVANHEASVVVNDTRRPCAVAVCPRFAKMDDLCLMHRQRVHHGRHTGRWV